jgi:extradiol dioxygenase family protein
MLFSLSVPVDAQQQDVTFFVIGKHANFDQFPDGSLKPVDFSFFSEIFFTENGDAQDAFMNMPTSERIRFRDQRLVEGPDKDNLLLISGAKRFSSYAELLSWYPDGVYEIEFDTPSGSVSNVELEFPVNGLPNPPNISLYQDGKPVCGVVDPDKALEVRWSEFTQGGADENGILDDLIFAILEDETGRRVSHSGRPFEGKPYLTYVNTLHTIDAAAMQDKKEYTLSVEHAVLTDTSKFDSVPAMTTYAVTTRLKFRTGAASGTDCSAESREENIDMGLTTDAQVVMFYYKDLTDADHFYGDILGLEKTLDEDWVKFYKTSANATVGLVAESEGAWHQAQEKNAVMLSIVTSEVDAWYEMLRQKEGVSFLKEIGDGGPIRSFLIEDPGGYTVEFFEWLEAGNQ